MRKKKRLQEYDILVAQERLTSGGNFHTSAADVAAARFEHYRRRKDTTVVYRWGRTVSGGLPSLGKRK